MYKGLKLIHHSHSLRLRPHEHTSYLPLFLLLVITGVVLTFCTVSAQSPGPGAGSVGLTGSMPGKAPTTAATITQPSNGQHFTTSPITVAGTCPAGTLVEVFKNDIFAGSSQCGDNGRYSFEIDLLIGQNILMVRVFDALNQAGPDSGKVTVYYDILPPQADGLTSLDFGATQLLISTDAAYRGIFPEQEFNAPLSILGGTPPYAVTIEWGDTEKKTVPRNDNQTFNVDHSYHKAGVYQVSIQAADSQERVAFLTVAAIVNGQPPAAVAANTPDNSLNKFIALWPLFIGAITTVFSFWLGERREKRVLNRSLQPAELLHKPTTPAQSASTPSASTAAAPSNPTGSSATNEPNSSTGSSPTPPSSSTPPPSSPPSPAS